VPAQALGPGLTEDAKLASAWPNELGSCCTSAACVAVLDVTALGCVSSVTALQ
jgi:hypothetical protein